jgi:hypothetical protein
MRQGLEEHGWNLYIIRMANQRPTRCSNPVAACTDDQKQAEQIKVDSIPVPASFSPRFYRIVTADVNPRIAGSR